MEKPLRASKQILHEEVQKLKKVGGYWIWPKEPENLGNGYFRTFCTFGREKNDPNPITVIGEAKGKKAAEHAAASEILKTINSDTSEIPSDNIDKDEKNLHNCKQNQQFPHEATSDDNCVAAMTIFCALFPYMPQWFKEQQRLPSKQKGTLLANREKVKSLLAKLTRELESSVFAEEIKSEDELPEQNSISTNTPPLSMLDNAFQDNDNADLLSLDQPTPFKRKSILDSTPSGVPMKVSDKVYYYSGYVLGAGKITQVYRGYLEDECRTKAIKKVTLEDSNIIERVKSEDKSLEKMKKLNHEYFVQYYFTEKLDAHVYYVFEPADCTLESFITESQPVEAKILNKICTDITKGLNNLHGQRMFHGDINPQNVFIFLGDKNPASLPIAKLTAFGLSRVVNQANNYPDEEFELKRSRDIFQLGLTFGFTMTAGIPLVKSNEDDKQIFESFDVDWTLLRDPKFTTLRNLLQKMLRKNPVDRGDISILLEHPFFWDVEKSLRFIAAVAADIKQNQVPCNKIDDEYEGYTYKFGITDNWKLRLDTPIQDWMLKEQRLEDAQPVKTDNKKKPWHYKSTSAVELIKFIRDQHEHYENWKPLVKDASRNSLEDEKIWGHKGCNFGRYFVTKFPELTTILYNVMQKEEFQGNRTKSFYVNNDQMCFDLAWDGII